MSEKTLKYQGRDIQVQYDVKRCIHAAECVNGLPSVFDPNAKPWVDADGASAADVARVIMRCPSGALHYAPEDEALREPVPAENNVRVEADGPLYMRGDIEIRMPDGTTVLKDTRVALCRCGASKNKPFCDNSHGKAGFNDPGILGEGGLKTTDTEQPGLRVVPALDGPFLLTGMVSLCSTDGETVVNFNKAALCRCGGSSNKPFCDGTHKRIGFKSA